MISGQMHGYDTYRTPPSSSSLTHVRRRYNWQEENMDRLHYIDRQVLLTFRKHVSSYLDKFILNNTNNIELTPLNTRFLLRD